MQCRQHRPSALNLCLIQSGLYTVEMNPSPSPTSRLPTFDDVLVAAARLSMHATLTPVLHARSLDALAGAQLVFKAENLQRSGAFKFRGACNAVFALADEMAGRGVVTHSSGNHGAALALAARERGIGCHVVVPEDTLRSKQDAIRAYGATLHHCAPGMAAREAVCAQIQARTSARLIHPFTHPEVIAGQGTAMLELLHACPDLDAVVVPVGGGGLAAGTALVLAELAPKVRLYLAEPVGAADAAASLRSGERVTEITPDTVCDGLRGLLGAPNFELLASTKAEVLVVEDADTLAAQRLLMMRSKMLVEPSSATVLAAVLAYPEHFACKRVGLVLSGGNLDWP